MGVFNMIRNFGTNTAAFFGGEDCAKQKEMIDKMRVLLKDETWFGSEIQDEYENHMHSRPRHMWIDPSDWLRSKHPEVAKKAGLMKEVEEGAAKLLLESSFEGAAQALQAQREADAKAKAEADAKAKAEKEAKAKAKEAAAKKEWVDVSLTHDGMTFTTKCHPSDAKGWKEKIMKDLLPN